MVVKIIVANITKLTYRPGISFQGGRSKLSPKTTRGELVLYTQFLGGNAILNPYRNSTRGVSKLS